MRTRTASGNQIEALIVLVPEASYSRTFATPSWKVSISKLIRRPFSHCGSGVPIPEKAALSKITRLTDGASVLVGVLPWGDWPLKRGQNAHHAVNKSKIGRVRRLSWNI